jgi:cation diffusion facilitator CzcD-associated flavoprotein CzcO
MDRRDRHCIVGAGPSGLGAAKAFKDAGIEYDQVEADDAIGGNWYHGVYDSTHIISSRDGTGYSDFPMPADYPDFPSRDQMLAYVNDYADRFGLRDRIELNAEVTAVEPLSPHGMAGWRVTLANGESRDYAGVVVANGHHWKQRIPDFPGEFAGKSFHSKDYKRPSDFDGERVVVVGAGNSACDIAVEAARSGFDTYLSIRRGTHFLPKTFFGIPADQFDRWWMPVFAQKQVLKALLALTVGPNERYGVPPPEHDLFERHPTVNSELLYMLKHGRIGVKPNVALLDGRRVEFTDGSELDVDTIVYATGYDVEFPFLDHGMFEWDGRYPKLVGQMFPPGYANLYIWGLGQPRGGAGPLVTAGSRLMAKFVLLQREWDRPLSNVIARFRRPEARELFGMSELMRLIKLGELGVPFLRLEARLMSRNGHERVAEQAAA